MDIRTFFAPRCRAAAPPSTCVVASRKRKRTPEPPPAAQWPGRVWTRGDGWWEASDIVGRRFQLRPDGHLYRKSKRQYNRVHWCTECGAAFAKSSNLTEHKRTHTGDKPFECTECGAAFAKSSHLTVHMRTHTGERPFEPPPAAQWPGRVWTRGDGGWWEASDLVGRRFQLRPDGHLYRKFKTQYNRVHWCATCGKGFRGQYHLTVHMRHHTGERPFECTECGAAFVDSSNLLRHKESWHTPAGQARKKKEEQRVCRALLAAGYTETKCGDWCPPPRHFQREKHIDFRCLANARAKYARIDFVINTGEALVFLEVDEYQHCYGYGQAGCDMRRMARVMEVLVVAGCTTPVHWVRYNPHARKVDGATETGLTKAAREAALVAKLRSLPASEAQLGSVGYMYYDVRSTAGGARRPEVVLDDAAFHSHWAGRTWCV